jgi:hypothetical protein
MSQSAHYGWCSVVGGSGVKPGSWAAMQAEYRAKLAVKAAAEAEEAERRASNNGWVKYKGDERSYEHLRDVGAAERRAALEAGLDVAVRRANMRSAAPVARDKGRPGKELSKYWREIANRVLELNPGWTYEVDHNHPRLLPPNGGRGVNLPKTVTEGDAGHRAAYLTALKRAGAQLDGAA